MNEPEVEIKRIVDPEHPYEKNEPEIEQTPQNRLNISIQKEGGFVIVYFGKPITHIKITKKDARQFAARLNKEAL